MSGNVKCPVHGEHGNLSNGRCWYCVQSGNAPSSTSTEIGRKKVLTTSTSVGKKRKIA